MHRRWFPVVLCPLLVLAAGCSDASSGDTASEPPAAAPRAGSRPALDRAAGRAPRARSEAPAPLDGAAREARLAATPRPAVPGTLSSAPRGLAPPAGAAGVSDAAGEPAWVDPAELPGAAAEPGAPARGAAHPGPDRRYPVPPERPARPERPAAPPAAPRDMQFRDYGVNPWQDARRDNLSTFAMDVDTGSYTLARAYILDEGVLPPIEAVRAEEFVNYLDQDYPAPERGAFSITVDGAPSPFAGRDDEWLLRVGLKGREIAPARRRDAVLTFVVDVSGSMEEDGRLELVKDALLGLVDRLRPGDEVAIVAYSDDAWVVLEHTDVRERGRIRGAIGELHPTNSTNAEAGLRLGYDLADAVFRPDAVHRVILCSDGVANVGVTDPQGILARIEARGRDGITLTTIGVGMGNYNDVLLEQLADRGDGRYHYVDTRDEARAVFGDDLVGTLQVIAMDAKVQVELNPETVDFYRLIGYENRDVADPDFRDDRVDAGEIGAGHTVTALYAVRLAPGAEGELGVVRVRFRDPHEGTTREDAQVFGRRDLADRFGGADARFRLTAAAAAFAEILRDGHYADSTTLSQVGEVASGAARELFLDGQARELATLVERAGRLERAYGAPGGG